MKSKKDTAKTRAEFKISIFGTGSIKNKHDAIAIEFVKHLTKKIVKDKKHQIIAGWYEGGVMGTAIDVAQREARKLKRKDLLPEGVILGDQSHRAPEGSDIIKVKNLPEELGRIMEKSKAYVVMHGQTGTIIEMFTTLWSEAIEHLIKEKNKDFVPKPIIVVDSSPEYADLLDILVKKDKHIKNAMQDIYIINLDPNQNKKETDLAAEAIIGILELYYKKYLGKILNPKEEQSIKKLGLESFLKKKDTFKDFVWI